MTKKIRRIIILILILTIITGGYFLIKNLITLTKKETEEITIIDEITKYEYYLEETKTPLYKLLFSELKETLTNEEVDKLEYAKLISKMFIADFYDLDSKLTKSDVGGIELIHSDIKEEVIIKAKDTIYKYIENNLYNDRTQELPSVTDITVTNVEIITYEYSNEEVEGYQVDLNWSYNKDLGYQTSASIILIHEDKKLSIVELK
jgi:hypothetical protein